MLEEIVELEYHPHFFGGNGSFEGVFQARHHAEYRRLARAGESHESRHLAALHLEVHAAQDLPRSAKEAQTADLENGAHDVVGAFHRASRRRARGPSGSDIRR